MSTIASSKIASTLLQMCGLASSIEGAWFTSNEPKVMTLLRSINNVDDNTSRQYIDKYLITGNRQSMSLGSVGIQKLVFYDISSFGTSIAAINMPLSASDKTNYDASYLEINSGEGILRLDTSSVHGKVVGGSWFGGQSFSSDGRVFVYVAQPLKSKKVFLLDSIAEDVSGSNKFEFEEDWGEKNTELAQTCLYLLTLSPGLKASVQRIEGIDYDRYTVGQPVLRVQNDSKSMQIVYTAWENLPRKLGMIYCFQRPSSIHLHTLATQSSVCLSSGLVLGRSPRLSPCGQRLAFLGHQDGFLAHNSAMQVYEHSFDTGSLYLVLDTVHIPDLTSTSEGEMQMGFPGLYCDQLPRQPYIEIDRRPHLLCSSMLGCHETLVIIDPAFASSHAIGNAVTSKDGKGAVRLVRWSRLLSRALKQLSTTDMSSPLEASGSLLAVLSSKCLLVGLSTPITPTALLLFDLEACLAERDNCVTLIEHHPRIYPVSYKHHASLVYPVFPWNDLVCKSFLLTRDGVPFQCILLAPGQQALTANKKLPLIVVPHGGPHSVTPSSFLASYASICAALDAAVLHVNYRGKSWLLSPRARFTE
jgi:acylaminoacyl-peptidase